MSVLTVVSVVVALAAGGVLGFLLSRSQQTGDAANGALRRLDEYDFYPFDVNDSGHVEFNPDSFNTAVRHLLAERNDRAAKELIVIGEQNLVRDTFPSDRLDAYKRLFAAYDGNEIVLDNDQYLENYRRIVHHFGRSFPNTGIEVLLHNLVNPARSLEAIENGEVTGRSPGSGATNLVLDLKTRRQRGEDKVNYELNIGARQFKCTTVPIFRKDYGLVGAVCINVDARFIREAVAADRERLDAFIDNLLRTDMQLDENILSPDEYANALRGKRHYLDEAIRGGSSGPATRRLAAIFFSDIVGYTTLMGDDEAATLTIVAANEGIHAKAFAAHGGRLVKKLGDGLLASFDSASDAVAAARAIRASVAADGRFGVRIGIHVGEIVESDHDVHGDGVNIASRIQAEVGPGQIGVSSVVFDNVRNKNEIHLSALGERTLKNVAQPIDLYLVDEDPEVQIST
jgi:class 3 adenylate cyclase